MQAETQIQLKKQFIEKDGHRNNIYRGLIRKNFQAIIQNAFPLLISHLNTDQQETLLTDFLKSGGTPSPLYHETPSFVQKFLLKQENTFGLKTDLFKDLINYDLATYSIHYLDDFPALPPQDPNIPILKLTPILNPKKIQLNLTYPVYECEEGKQVQDLEKYPENILILLNKKNELQILKPLKEHYNILKKIEKHPLKALKDFYQEDHDEVFQEFLIWALKEEIILGFLS